MPDYTNLIRRIVLPAGFQPPTELIFDDIVATVLGRRHLRDDVDGINASLDLIRKTRGGEWPTEPVTDEFDFTDLVWHECEFREGNSYSYAVYTAAGEYLGCCYFYPVGTRTPLSADLIKHDVDVSWWVTPSAYDRGYYDKLFRAVRKWSSDDYPFENPHFSNVIVPD